MKRTALLTHYVLPGLVATALLTVPGCQWFGKSNPEKAADSTASDTQGEPFIRFNDKTVLSFEGFKNKLKLLQETQPGIEALLQSMPEGEQLRVYSQLAEGCQAEKLVIEHVKEKGLANTAEFKELAQQAHEALDTRLFMQAFETEMRKTVSDSVNTMSNNDLRTFYESNRDKNPMFQGEPFVKRPGKDEKTPTKKEYAPFDTVIDMVKEVIKQEKLNELVQSTLEDLKKRHGASIEAACLQRLVVKKSSNDNTPVLPADESDEAEPTPATKTQAA